jgi:hypothetical protein
MSGIAKKFMKLCGSLTLQPSLTKGGVTIAKSSEFEINYPSFGWEAESRERIDARCKSRDGHGPRIVLMKDQPFSCYF